MIERCLLDMDGVISDLMLALAHKYNETYDVLLPPGKQSPYDLGTVFGRRKAEIWDSLDYEFWASLPKTRDADDIAGSVVEIFGEANICICTSISTSSPGCYEGKMAWLRTNYPVLAKRVMTVGPKCFAAGPRTLLIDDCETKTDAFRRAGGKAVVVPRRWNSMFRFDGVSGYIDMAVRLVLKNAQ